MSAHQHDDHDHSHAKHHDHHDHHGSDNHHGHNHGDAARAATDPRYRQILWFALVVNAAMFALELGAGFKSGSVSLLADAIDFFSDAINYALTLAVLGSGLMMRSRAALFKGWCMLVFGVFVIARAAWVFNQGGTPEALTMGTVGLLALIANVSVAALLYAWREGDANMRSVWLCSRNDAIGNVAVMLAALGVLGTASAWPDLVVAVIMALLAIVGGWSVLGQARREMAAGSQTKVSL
jgi:Co/Zn/Cd efflux system component